MGAGFLGIFFVILNRFAIAWGVIFENYIIGSVEPIPLPDNSVDGIICAGSVVNYVDIQKAISEFSRVLKPHGFLIMEYERSNSAEFLFSKNYAKIVFLQKYKYNNQIHFYGCIMKNLCLN